MLSKIAYKIWRVVNMTIIVTGLMMTWADPVFDSETPNLTSGWEYLITRLVDALYYHHILLQMPELIFYLIFGVVDILLLYYVTFNFAAIANSRFSKKLHIVSLALCVSALFPCFLLFAFPSSNASEYFGFQTFALGLYSAAILEWLPRFHAETSFHPS